MTSDTPAPAQEAHVEALLPLIYCEHDGHPSQGSAARCRLRRDETIKRILASDWLAAFVAERQAEAWDRGHASGAHDVVNAQLWNHPPTPNPYRIGGASC